MRELGHGGMGYVYEAIDQRVNCLVAIKETITSDNEESRRAFEREAALLANLRHRGLPKVMDYFSENEGDFLVMEFIPGRDLAELLDARGRAFSQPEVLHWADELLSILVYLHSREPPILHRDIKPSNLKLSEDGELFLLDFGLAKGALGQMPTLVTSRSVRGYTPVYAPLEQILGQGTDPRSDLYSVAATLYHLLTGVPPVDAPTRFHAVEDEKPDPLAQIHAVNPQVAPNVSTFIGKAMGLSRKQRPSTANEMRHALKELAGEVKRQELDEYRNEEERKKSEQEEARKRSEKNTLKREHLMAHVRGDRGISAPAPAPTLPAPPPEPISFERAAPTRPESLPIDTVSQPWRRGLLVALGLFASVVVVVGVIWLANLFSRAPADQNENQTGTVSSFPQSSPTALGSPTQAPSPTPIVARSINPPREFLEFVKGDEAYSADSIHVKEIDLNLDGLPELIAQYQFCGSGGCYTHILRQNTEGGFQEIGGGVGEYLMPPLNRSAIRAGPTIMNGYLDIQYDRLYFTFDGRRYQCARGC
ncbi:MAG TPA: protein kinase [Pyrinomonadaceae bacterium]